MSVNPSARPGGTLGVSFWIFFIMKVYCVFSFQSPHRGDSNEYTQYTIFNIKKKNNMHYPKFTAVGIFPDGLSNEFETAMVNEPSVFEPLKFYCICFIVHSGFCFFYISCFVCCFFFCPDYQMVILLLLHGPCDIFFSFFFFLHPTSHPSYNHDNLWLAR